MAAPSDSAAVAVAMTLTLEVIAPESLAVTALVQNTGTGPVRYACGPWIPRIRLINVNGEDIRLWSACLHAMPCRIPVSTLQPRQARSSQALITGRFDADCQREPLPAGTYAVRAELWYWAESEPAQTGRHVAEKEVIIKWPMERRAVFGPAGR